jgi:hypothetical protein
MTEPNGQQEDMTMMSNKHALTRRQYLAATGAATLAAGLGARPALALDLVR